MPQIVVANHIHGDDDVMSPDQTSNVCILYVAPVLSWHCDKASKLSFTDSYTDYKLKKIVLSSEKRIGFKDVWKFYDLYTWILVQG